MELRREPYWYESVGFGELQVHLRNLLDVEKTVDRIEIELVREKTYISLLRKEFSKKPAEFLMVIRVSDLGRDALAQIDKILSDSGLNIYRRRSAKKKLLSQLHARFSSDADDYPDSIIYVLRKIAKVIGREGLNEVSIGYSGLFQKKELPGNFVSYDIVWSLGYKIGKGLGKLLR